MPSYLHPRSRSTVSLFGATLCASFLIVGIPHIFPCPAPRRALADSKTFETFVSPDGQVLMRRRRRKSDDGLDVSEEVTGSLPAPNEGVRDEENEIVKFKQLQAEANIMVRDRRECPVPKPGGIVGRILGFEGKGTSSSDGANGNSLQ